MKSSAAPANKHGFTLLEILIALFIFAIMAVIAVTGLRSVLNARSETMRHEARLGELQIAMVFLQQDIEQAIDRPILSRTGSPLPTFIGSDASMQFTRAGVANPGARLPRSTLERVGYRYSGDELVRLTWAELDQAPASKPNERVILRRIKSLQFRYLDNNLNPNPRWPGVNVTSLDTLPRAVEVNIDLQDSGTMSLLFIIHGQTLNPQLTTANNTSGGS